MKNEQLRAGDWYAIGAIFPKKPFYYDNPSSGAPSAKAFGVSLGVQVLVAMDVASQRFLCAMPLEKSPSAFTSADVIKCLGEAFKNAGKPRIGVLISPSVWMSSNEMLLEDCLHVRVEHLQKLEIEISPMPIGEKELLAARLRSLDLEVVFNEDELPPH